MKQVGPSQQIVNVCVGCQFFKVYPHGRDGVREDIYCLHPGTGVKDHLWMGESSARTIKLTPSWCPVLSGQTISEHLDVLEREVEDSLRRQVDALDT